MIALGAVPLPAAGFRRAGAVAPAGQLSPLLGAQQSPDARGEAGHALRDWEAALVELEGAGTVLGLCPRVSGLALVVPVALGACRPAYGGLERVDKLVLLLFAQLRVPPRYWTEARWARASSCCSA